ncbi:MAG: RNA polymerase sigma factor SigJ [Pseudonocardiaceae bacterium]
MSGVTDAEAAFCAHRGALLGLAYRILGSLTEAEDVVQEAWLRWDRAIRSAVPVREPKAYLLKITANAALDQVRVTGRARESYVGPWLPEPLLTTPDGAEQATIAESVSMAMLVVLQTLSPLERAAFVLREAFGFGYGEVAAVLGRSEPAVRQLVHRAREHVQARRPRFEPDQHQRRSATECFLQAAGSGDLNALLEVLAPEVTLVADSGGQVRAPRRTIAGATKVARFFAAIAPDIPAGTDIHIATVNGTPAGVATLRGLPYAVFALDVTESGQVDRILLVANPDKLAGLSRAWARR